MTRTTITIPEDLLKRLKKMAAEKDVSMAALIREALEDKANQNRPKPSMGIFDSGHTDTAQMASDHRIFQPRSWR